jgi:hypothetical protein
MNWGLTPINGCFGATVLKWVEMAPFGGVFVIFLAKT